MYYETFPTSFEINSTEIDTKQLTKKIAKRAVDQALRAENMTRTALHGDTDLVKHEIMRTEEYTRQMIERMT